MGRILRDYKDNYDTATEECIKYFQLFVCCSVFTPEQV